MKQLRVDLLLTCNHIVSIPIESVLAIPALETELVCATCHEKARILKAGNPYHVALDEDSKPADSSQISMLEQ